jgi:hypothetical protein
MPPVDWERWFLATVMIAIAIYHLGRPVAAELWSRRVELVTDLSHAAMGSTMALMLLTPLTAQADHLWSGLFLFCSLWFIARSLRLWRTTGRAAVARPAGEALLSAAMVVMLADSSMSEAGSGVGARSPMDSMAGLTRSSTGTSDLVLAATSRPVVAVLLLALALATIANFRTESRSSTSSCSVELGRPACAPTVTAYCGVVMSAISGYMLILVW